MPVPRDLLVQSVPLVVEYTVPLLATATDEIATGLSLNNSVIIRAPSKPPLEVSRGENTQFVQDVIKAERNKNKIYNI